MTVSYIASLKTTRMVAVINAIDANASPGFIEIGTAGNMVVTGLTVGASQGFDIVLTSTAITSGQPVTLNSMTITHAP
jgi:hypothetical protein